MCSHKSATVRAAKRKLKHLFCTQEECFTTALECLKKELNGTVKAECNDDNDYIGQGVKVLQIMIKKTQEKNHVSISPHYVAKPMDESIKFAQIDWDILSSP